MNTSNKLYLKGKEINDILKLFLYSNSILVEDEIPNTYPVPFANNWTNLGDNIKDLNPIYKKLEQTLPKSLYIGIPFCNYRCGFCVYSIKSKYNKNILNNYLEYIRKEFQLLQNLKVEFSNIKRIYIGGGTPSILDNNSLEILIKLIESIGVKFSKIKSFTIEVSPESITEEKIKTIKKYVNRISMGIQDIHTNVLLKNNRKTQFSRIESSIQILRDNIQYFNVDLIYGLNGQTEKDWIETIMFAINNKIPEVTLYNRRIGENSIIKERSISLVQEKIRLLIAKNLLESDYYIQVRPFHWVRDKKIKALWKDYKYAPYSDQHSKKSGYEIGIGTSAVTHIDNVLYKNFDVSKISKYKGLLDLNHLPIEKKYQLNHNDYIIRRLLYGIEEGKFIYNELDNPYRLKINRLYHQLTKFNLIEKKYKKFLLTQTGLLFYNNIEKEIIELLKNLE